MRRYNIPLTETQLDEAIQFLSKLDTNDQLILKSVDEYINSLGIPDSPILTGIKQRMRNETQLEIYKINEMKTLFMRVKYNPAEFLVTE